MTEPQDPQQPESTQPIQPPQPIQPQPIQPPQYAPPADVPQYAQPSQPQYAQPVQPQYAQQPMPPQYNGYPGQYGAPQPPKKGLSAGAIVGIVAGAVVLLMFVVFGGLIAFGAFVSSVSGSSGSSDYAGEEPLGSPGDIVEEYLNALADGDAATARDIVGETSSNSMLSDEVLKKSLELAPMTNISVDEDSIQKDYDEATVSASFDLGDKTITRDFTVWNNYDGEWELSDGLVDVSLSSFKSLGPIFNGVKITDDYVMVFPGTYEVDMSVEAFTIDSDSNRVTLADDSGYSSDNNFTPVLTEKASKLFTELVSNSLKECLALNTLKTPCGNNVDAKLADGSTVADGDIKRTLTTEGVADLQALKPRPDWQVPTSVSAPALVDIDVSLTNENDKRSRWMFGGRLLTPTVDFAAENPTVTWKK
ncbi:hypothetical protein G7068_15585 [Leucobacter viscericola]|uniref:DUF4878 domain-containing protein n=1 Tax=Leucobacter viscericola TaxID=2714935 RepID=A0A6G7XIY1_9MICO|nr:hypothetical protein [Leucobacter viscericola]QIK64472.1 hypothetical protein G7068_15585 [Leucobacter viscericola]